MFVKATRLFFVRPTAGFLPARDGTLHEAPPVSDRAPATALRAAASAMSQGRTPTWAPASSARIAFVETLLGASVMAYFAFGLASAVGLF